MSDTYFGFLVEDDDGNIEVNDNPDNYEYDNYLNDVADPRD